MPVYSLFFFSMKFKGIFLNSKFLVQWMLQPCLFCQFIISPYKAHVWVCVERHLATIYCYQLLCFIVQVVSLEIFRPNIWLSKKNVFMAGNCLWMKSIKFMWCVLGPTIVSSSKVGNNWQIVWIVTIFYYICWSRGIAQLILYPDILNLKKLSF